MMDAIDHDNPAPITDLELRVLDRDEHGIDAAQFHAAVLSQPGRFDFNSLNARCNVQVQEDVTPRQLAQFVGSGQVRVSDLLTCIIAVHEETPEDSYKTELMNLARRSATEDVTNRVIDTELDRLCFQYNAKKKSVEKDYKRACASFSASSAALGILSNKDSSLLRPMKNYEDQYAIVRIGNSVGVMDMNAEDPFQSVIPNGSFELLHRTEWIEVDGNTIYPAKEFMKRPPRGTRRFEDGFVFKPSGTVPPSQFNLYPGMQVRADPSGSCSLLHDLIHEVWAQGDREAAEWALEYLMHIVASPGEKVGTCLAIRGPQGVGKSLPFELLRDILGKMLIVVANQNVILGDYNEAIGGKLLTVLDEAAFAHQPAQFDQLKSLITGAHVTINPKFKAPITIDNYSRLVVLSNRDHFVNLDTDDRRYTVLNAGTSWMGTEKFGQLVDQWRNGGAARFVFESLNHQFRRLGETEQLVIGKKKLTEAAIEQVALSRQPIDQWVVSLLTTGCFGGTEGMYWPLGSVMSVTSEQLNTWAREWVGTHHPAAARQVGLPVVVKTLTKYLGELPSHRGKGPSIGGKRVQLPTTRVLPPRREVLGTVRAKALITRDEYHAGIESEQTSDQEIAGEMNVLSLPKRQIAVR